MAIICKCDSCEKEVDVYKNPEGIDGWQKLDSYDVCPKCSSKWSKHREETLNSFFNKKKSLFSKKKKKKEEIVDEPKPEEEEFQGDVLEVLKRIVKKE